MSWTVPAAAWFFRPAPRQRLAAVRVVTAGYCLYYLGRRRHMLRRIVRDEPYRYDPVGVARVAPRPLAPALADGLTVATYAATAAALAGWRYPISGPAWAVLQLWTHSYRNSWSMVFHDQNLPVLHGIVLGLSPAADALSIDALQRRPAGPPPAGYGWPLQLMNAITVTTYTLAGVAKITGPAGWSWSRGESLRRHVAVDGLRKQAVAAEHGHLPTRVFRSDGLWRALATGSLLMELIAPAALLSRRIGKAWAIGSWGMHVGVLAIMRIRFRYQLSGAAFLSFFEPEQAGTLARRLGAVLRSRTG